MPLAAHCATPNVISVGIDEPVLKAARLMLQKRISGLPVLNNRGENRAGKNLPESRRKILHRAKAELRRQFGRD